MSDPAMPVPSQSVTLREAIILASRLFAAYLLFWVIADAIDLPRQLLSVAHYMQTTGTVLGTNTSMPINSYELREYMLYLLANLLRIALWLAGAGWLYRCGPRVVSFFAAGSE